MATTTRLSRTQAVMAAAGLLLVLAMAVDTKVVKIGSGADVAEGVFSPATYGAAEFPKVAADVEKRAVDAATLAAAIAKNADDAATKYGVAAQGGPEFPVRFTGKVSEGDNGDEVAVPGMPADVHITLQTGPAIIGTDLRDATGTISFGQFHNQIEYQNAGAAINDAMKKTVLVPLETTKLVGRTVSVVGAFQLTDPQNWQVTPVKLSVQ